VWELVSNELEEDLFQMRNFAPPDVIKRVHREAHLELLARQEIGLLVTRAAITGVNVNDLPAFAKSSGEQVARSIAADVRAFEKKRHKSAERYEAIS